MKITVRSPGDDLFATEKRSAYVVIEYEGRLFEVVPIVGGLQIRTPHDRLIIERQDENVVVAGSAPYPE